MASNQFDTSLPSTRQVQRCIKEKVMVEFKLMTGDLITGRVFWQDHNCICIFDGNNEQITVWKQAIVYIKPLVDIVGERG
ncbi:RNA-binding protein hfq [Dolichospermum sp. ST_con]|nr:RNA-binding protein hfq [Dolichospermum sp. ST_con]MDD1419639.1 RNA-binding protein hfq [Dolichospermum sp. ST_sed1]MDD1428284.1 RNA-binding protein hfq [Dolichospermum sp. ST_sed9]MDD1431834.1 RNA-binding protein hfq [Dolichospermum sp. ST_sed6]MDD1436634.1 RNA-binding protein hfq [Dolichospermum sp. ST_sed10]MDD1440533.1 RNA-binding protein hfq [Dolichospermum sp. ST_sed3]MDD1446453.1 RNA-binding protein hfq [Dolichospermum sp. ST_sed8]MDD1455203.1 RNA-binding protein hfq [Dolichospermu